MESDEQVTQAYGFDGTRSLLALEHGSFFAHDVAHEVTQFLVSNPNVTELMLASSHARRLGNKNEAAWW